MQDTNIDRIQYNNLNTLFYAGKQFLVFIWSCS